ncbi:ABC transporter permease [Spiroplasma alleghenense]|uniref:Uncharacterized protein n=1 Tax=Spiroplasma alleghenense TaxID=216931 RepID=A0A345Z546_9MOLU|nr:ABC transporter permease [Spiroplasma alleghenense]AXK51725.1 hypothetical protein SALLE_v1c10550 [Spiroplasma alleghenense]
MNSNFNVIFKFSFLRIIKNKLFIILSTIVILLIVLVQVLAMTIGDSILYKTQVGMIFIIVLSIFWISFININNITTISIIDDKNGLQSLQNRRGVKNSKIFFAKLLPLKIITTFFILLVFLIFITIALASLIPLKSFVVGNLGIGIFSLIAYDFFIFGIVILISSKTKSMKKTLPVGWILMTLFMFFSIFGPIFFVFSSGSYAGNEFHPRIKNKFSLVNTQTEETKFLSELSVSLEKLENTFYDNIIEEENSHGLSFKYLIVKLAFRGGMLTNFAEMIARDHFEQYIDQYLINFDTSLDQEGILINEQAIKTELENNIYYKFIKSFNITAIGDKGMHFRNSFFYKVSSRNFNSYQQLGEVMKKFENIQNIFSISDSEKQAFKNSVLNNYHFELSMFSNDRILDKSIKNSKEDFFNNYAMWIESSSYSPGSYLFNLVSYNLLSSFNYPFEIDRETFKWKADAILNYQINPFMLFYEMVYFSGKNDILSNYAVYVNSPLPISNFNFYDLDANGELIYTNRPFIVWLNYLIFISLGIGMTWLGYLAFCQTKDKRKLVD